MTIRRTPTSTYKPKTQRKSIKPSPTRTTSNTTSSSSSSSTRTPVSTATQQASRTRAANADATARARVGASNPSGTGRAGGSASPPPESAQKRVERTRADAQEAITAANDVRARYDDARRDLLQASLPRFLGGSSPAERGDLDKLRRRTSLLRDASFNADKNAYEKTQTALDAQREAGVAPARARVFGGQAPVPTHLENLTPGERQQVAGQDVPSRIANIPDRIYAQSEEGQREAQVNAAVDDINRAVDGIDGDADKGTRNGQTINATETLERTLREAPPELRGEILEQSRDAIERLTPNLKDLNKDETTRAVENLTTATEHAGAQNAHLLTDPIAEQVQAGSLEERGSFLGRHDHRSEQEFSDSVHEVMQDSGSDLFARSLANQLHERGDTGFANAIATHGGVPGKNLLERGSELFSNAVDNVTGFVGDIANAGGDFIRNKIADIAQIDQRVAELNSEGDSFTLGLGGEAAAGVSVGASAEMEVQRTDDGYTVTVTGEASAGIFGQLGAKAGIGGGALEGQANVTGQVQVEAHFDSLEEAQQAASTIAGIGIGTAVGGPAGAVATGATATDELRAFGENVTATRIGVELSGSVAAELGTEVGHAGLGGSAEIEASTSATVEIRPGEAPALIVGSELSGEASLNVGMGDLEMPGGGSLNLGSVGAKGGVSVETRIPLEGFSVQDALTDPVGTLRAIPGRIADSETTLKAEVTLEGEINPSVNLPGDNQVGFNGGGGALTAEIAATMPTSELGTAARRALSGDLGGAIRGLSDEAQLDIQIAALDRRGFEIDADISAGIFKVGVEAAYMTDDKTDIFTFEGTPRELGREAADFFDTLTDPLTESVTGG